MNHSGRITKFKKVNHSAEYHSFHHTPISNIPHFTVRNCCFCQFLEQTLRFGNIANYRTDRCQNLAVKLSFSIRGRQGHLSFQTKFCSCCVKFDGGCIEKYQHFGGGQSTILCLFWRRWANLSCIEKYQQKSISIFVAGNLARRENGGFWAAKHKYCK